MFVTLGTYSISILHYSLFYQDERVLTFRRPIRVHKGLETDFYMYSEDQEALTENMRDKLSDPQFIYDFALKHQKDWEMLMAHISQFKTTFTDKELAAYFTEYWNLLQQAQPLGDCFLTMDEVYMEGTRKWVVKRLKELGREDELNEVMIILSSPWKDFPTMTKEIEFHALARHFQGKDIPEHAIQLPGYLKERFMEHHEGWCWIPHWYDNDPLSTKFHMDELKKLQNVDVEKKHKELSTHVIEIKKKAEQLLKELQPDKEMQTLIAGLREFTYFRTQLDLHTSEALYTARPIYYDIAKRLGLTFRELKNLAPNEVIQFVEEQDKDEAKRLASERTELAVEMFDMDEQKILVGEEAEEWVKRLEKHVDHGEKIDENVKTFTGVGASPGLAEGPARVITSVEEVKTVEDGEILVVPATSIDFLVAMKKSIAIVTEVGGLTSHAAIVARELGIPCVVNTKIATKVLKSGQKIRVDGRKGLVDIL